MYIEVNFSMFRNAFAEMGRENNFSYNGLAALFEYLEAYELEVDVIALCCEFTEYETAREAAAAHGRDFQDEEDALEFLREETTVIEFDGGLIIQDF